MQSNTIQRRENGLIENILKIGQSGRFGENGRWGSFRLANRKYCDLNKTVFLLIVSCVQFIEYILSTRHDIV